MHQIHTHVPHMHHMHHQHIHRHAPLNIKCTTKYICKVIHHVHMYVQDTDTCTTHAPHAPPIIYTTKYRINFTHYMHHINRHVPHAPLNTYTHMYQVHIHPQHKHTCTTCSTTHTHTCTSKHQMHHQLCTHVCTTYTHMYHTCTTKHMEHQIKDKPCWPHLCPL